jgi:small subunit ribosomal protein S4
MARYTGPKTKISRKLGESIYDHDKYFERRNYPPGQHGNNRRRKVKSEYALQLMEKQKAKYTYGVLEKQFRNLYDSASRKKGITGQILIQLLEARLDNTVYRLGLASTRRAARQMVSHKHITVNGVITNIPSYSLRSGDVIGISTKSTGKGIFEDADKISASNWSWLEWDAATKNGKFLNYPERDEVPEKIKEQLIVELYSK